MPPTVGQNSMAEIDFLKSYPAHVARLKALLPEDMALEVAVGGDFIAIGKLECALLRSLGLSEKHVVVDVGCGSGRLALQLAGIPGLRYLGTDVVPDLLGHARKICQRSDWDFMCTRGLAIPCEDGVADFVCFFSVFTHLAHEDAFRYLQEARRVLKPGGRVVFSFLEFYIHCHWEVFQQSLGHSRPGDPLNQFMDRHAIATWAERLGFHLDFIADGDKPHIPLEEDLHWPDGRQMRGRGNLGQSVAVLSNPADSAGAMPAYATATDDAHRSPALPAA
jgi:SAM-dependent methyltransferase